MKILLPLLSLGIFLSMVSLHSYTAAPSVTVPSGYKIDRVKIVNQAGVDIIGVKPTIPGKYYGMTALRTGSSGTYLSIVRGFSPSGASLMFFVEKTGASSQDATIKLDASMGTVLLKIGQKNYSLVPSLANQNSARKTVEIVFTVK